MLHTRSYTDDDDDEEGAVLMFMASSTAYSHVPLNPCTHTHLHTNVHAAFGYVSNVSVIAKGSRREVSHSLTHSLTHLSDGELLRSADLEGRQRHTLGAIQSPLARNVTTGSPHPTPHVQH